MFNGDPQVAESEKADIQVDRAQDAPVSDLEAVTAERDLYLDQLQRSMAEFANRLTFADLPAEVVHDCKRRIIDSIGCAIAAFDAEPSRVTRAISWSPASCRLRRCSSECQPALHARTAWTNRGSRSARRRISCCSISPRPTR